MSELGKDEIEDSAAPLIEHLAELRTRLIRSVIAFIIGIVLAFTVASPILQFLLEPVEATLRALGDDAPTLRTDSPQELLFVHFRISMVFGFGLAFPVIAHQLWRFVAPGLYRTEKTAFLPFLIASPLMFFLGAGFAHYIVIPLAMDFLLKFGDLQAVFSTLFNVAQENQGLEITFFGNLEKTLGFVLRLLMAFGICFQLPVLLTLMGKAGLVSARGLAHVRKYAMVGILVMAALITPPDVITQMILFTAVYGLYEVSIFLVKMVEKKKVDQLREEGILGEDEDLYSEFEDDEGELGADEEKP